MRSADTANERALIAIRKYLNNCYFEGVISTTTCFIKGWSLCAL